MRLFVGIRLAPAMCDEVIRQVEGLKNYQGYKWVKPEQLHITLKFLGETSFDRTKSLIDSLNAVTPGKKPFTISLGNLGKFPERGPVRVLWIGLKTGALQLTKLAEDVENACARAGFPSDGRRFQPHLTIARAKEGAGMLEFPRLEVSWQNTTSVSGFTLIESLLKPEGSVYRTVHEFSFQ